MPSTTTDQMAGHGPLNPDQIVLHCTEGIQRARDLAPFLRRAGVDVHLAIDRQGNAVHIVPDNRKAWHCGNDNGHTLGIEQCTPSGASAGWNQRDWVNGYHLGLLRVAAALSNWASTHPTIQLDYQPDRHGGICGHVHVGGGHFDPGSAYPYRYVILLARLHYYRKRGWNTPRHPARLRKFLSYKRQCHKVQRKYGVKPRTSL